jgi:hypothetical protein
VNLVTVQLVNHETYDPLAVLRNHADAITLTQDAKEFLLTPGVFEICVLDCEDLGHIAPDHPSNVHAGLRRGGWYHRHRASFHGTEQTNVDRLPPRNGLTMQY